MNQLERIAGLFGGILLAFTAAVVFRSGMMQSGRSRRKSPPVDVLADQLKHAWAGHHTA